MEAQLSVRIPMKLAARVKERARRLHLKRSDVVRIALNDFFEEPEQGDYPYERVKHLIGSIRSGVGNISSPRREDLIQRIRRRNFRG